MGYVRDVGEVILNTAIQRIDEIYRRIQDYVYPMGEFIDEILKEAESDIQEYIAMRGHYRLEYDNAVADLLKILPTLKPTEIAEAYREGSRLLQMNLSGYMAQNFDIEYISVMEEAITNGHVHSGGTFLEVFAMQFGTKISPIIGNAIVHKGLQHHALDIIGRLKLVEYLEDVKILCTNPDKIVQTTAKDALKSLTE